MSDGRQLKIDDGAIWPLFVAAFRYALGRRTYMPALIAGVIQDNKDLLTQYQREQLVSEVLEFRETWGNLGDKCDEVTWIRFCSELLPEEAWERMPEDIQNYEKIVECLEKSGVKELVKQMNEGDDNEKKVEFSPVAILQWLGMGY